MALNKTISRTAGIIGSCVILMMLILSSYSIVYSQEGEEGCGGLIPANCIECACISPSADCPDDDCGEHFYGRDQGYCDLYIPGRCHHMFRPYYDVPHYCPFDPGLCGEEEW